MTLADYTFYGAMGFSFGVFFIGIYHIFTKDKRVEKRRKREQAKNHQAYLDGYGWAWSVYKFEEKSLDEISHLALKLSGPTRPFFTSGVLEAVEDIRHYKMLELLQ